MLYDVTEQVVYSNGTVHDTVLPNMTLPEVKERAEFSTDPRWLKDFETFTFTVTKK